MYKTKIQSPKYKKKERKLLNVFKICFSVKLLPNFPKYLVEYYQIFSYWDAFSHFVKVNSITLMTLVFCSTLLPSPQNWELTCIYKSIPNSLTQRFIFHLLSLKVLYGCIKSISHFRGCSLAHPGSSAGKESICNAGDSGLIPGLGRSTEEGIDCPLQCSWTSLILQICPQCRRPGFNPWVGKIPWRRERLPTPVFWPGEFHGQRILAGVTKSWTWLSDLHTHFFFFLEAKPHMHFSHASCNS